MLLTKAKTSADLAFTFCFLKSTNFYMHICLGIWPCFLKMLHPDWSKLKYLYSHWLIKNWYVDSIFMNTYILRTNILVDEYTQYFHKELSVLSLWSKSTFNMVLYNNICVLSSRTLVENYKYNNYILPFFLPSGLPLISMAACGLHGTGTEELCTRWYQMAAFMPSLFSFYVGQSARLPFS